MSEPNETTNLGPLRADAERMFQGTADLLERQAIPSPGAVSAPPLGNLALALSKTQATVTGALKDSQNPFFKSQYADLASVWDACRGPLAENELAVIQLPSADGAAVSLRTVLVHSSGESIESTLTMTAKDAGPQAIGSCLTYLRRYMLSAMVGVAQVDDDGEGAMARTPKKPKKGKPAPTVPSAPERILGVKQAEGRDDLWWVKTGAGVYLTRDALTADKASGAQEAGIGVTITATPVTEGRVHTFEITALEEEVV